MARAIEKGQHIFIAFQGGKAVMDSQLRPRMYKSREQFEKSFPAWRDGKAELVEYAPTLTPPNEPLTCEGCAEDGKWEWEYQNGAECPCTYCKRRAADCYRRPPEGEA